jgi:uridylate kinase
MICRRILLKLSGEALMSEEGGSIDAKILKRLATEIKRTVTMIKSQEKVKKNKLH